MTRFHLVGIGGAGLSALARVLLARGEQVSGCDLKPSETTDALAAEGAAVMVGHDPAHLAEADVVVYTNVTSPTAEVEAARRQGRRLISRAQLLADLIESSEAIAVAGTHGKTTVTYMLGHILTLAGRDPTVLVGDGEHSRSGGTALLVAEADESDGTLVLHHPHHALVTNVELDHPDHFSSEQEFQSLFAAFLEALPQDGVAVLCADDPVLVRMQTSARRVDYGFAGSDYSCDEKRPFVLRHRGLELGRIEMRLVPGRHNIQNACGAAAMALELGVDFQTVARALDTFEGAHRRLEYLGPWHGARLYTDYGHHPTEVKATLQAARELHPKRLVLVFQPHRYSRFGVFRRRFAEALRGADLVLVGEIYPAGEDNPEGLTGRSLAEEVPGARFAPDLRSLRTELEAVVQPDDLVLLMGAGDIWELARELAHAA